jgi:phosphoglycerate kinase
MELIRKDEDPREITSSAIPLPTLRQMDAEELTGKTVVLRIDGSLPAYAAPKLWDERLKAALPSLDLLISAKARVVLLSHIEVPDGESSGVEAQRATCQRMGFLLGSPIGVVDGARGANVAEAVAGLGAGEALMLGNLALEPAEEDNEPEFARYLADLCDVYCNEAFPLAHQVRASTVGAVRRARQAVAGLEFKRELEIAAASLDNPRRPFLAVFGGSLSIDRLLLLEAIAARADVVLVGGEVCLAFLKAEGLPTGATPVPEEAAEVAARVLCEVRNSGRVLLLPEDFVIAAAREVRRPGNLDPSVWPGGGPFHLSDEIGTTEIAGDIGIDTLRRWSEQLGSARTVLWHGPLGLCEFPGFAGGTLFFGGQVAERTWPSVHRTVVCGESLTGVLAWSGFPRERIHLLSPAGTPILHCAARRPLPALEALAQSVSRVRRKHSIVVALVGLDEDTSLVSFAGSLFAETASIHFVYVVAGPDEDEYPDIFQAMTKEERMAEAIRATRVFGRAEAALASLGIEPATRELVHGDPSDRLNRRARDVGADVIVMGSSAAVRQRYSQAKVLAGAPCQVLVLPNPSTVTHAYERH